MDAFVVAPNCFAVVFEYGKLMLDGLQIAADIACIAELRDQFECNLFSTATNQQGDMRFLHTFGLVYSAAYLVVLALKYRFFLGPHGQNYLNGLSQTAQAVRSLRIVITVSTILVFVPTGPNAEVEPPVAQYIDGTGHFREQRGIAIAIARDCLTDADTLCVTCNGCGGGPTLKRYFL